MEFRSYTNSNGGKVSACVATADDAGTTVRLTNGQTHDVREGDVLIAAYRPDEYDLFNGTGDEFTDLYTADSGNDEAPVQTFTEPSGETVGGEPFDPNDHNASEVREYLSGDISDDERDRVIAAERAGKNRSSAFPA